MKNKRLILMSLACCFSLALLSQKMPEHEKKTYVAADGKLYIQKSLPVYLMLSTKPDDKANSVLLKSERSSNYTNPMYFDAEGLNTIRSPWEVDQKTKELVYPKQDIVYEVYADSKPPVSSINFSNNKFLRRNGRLYFNGKVEITLTATDQLSGVEKIMYSLDSADYKEYSSAIILDAEKEYVLKYYSYDHVGNVEALKRIVIVIDRTSPKTSMNIKGDQSENILSGNSLISLSADDASSGVASIKLKFDEGTEQNYIGAINTASIQQGEHKLAYWSVDNVENTEQQHEFVFYVDKTPPTILQEIIGKTYMINGKEFSSGQSQLKLTTLDNKAGVKEVFYSINNSEYKKYEKPVMLSAVSGSLEIKAYAVDKVNNKSQVTENTQASAIPYIDLSGPTLSYSLQGSSFITDDTIYISSKSKIVLKAIDNEAGLNNIQYKIDGKEAQVYNSPFSISEEGNHVVEYTGTDNVDNTSTSSIHLMVDNSGPVIYPRFSALPKKVLQDQGKTTTIYPGYVDLFVAATDIESGYEKMVYSINGSKEKQFNGFINGFAKNNEVIIKAYDKLGNESSVKLEFSIKN
jgi:hypothetical protein